MNELQTAVKDAITAMLIKFNNRLSKSQMEPESKLADWAEFLAFERGYTVNQVKFALTELTKGNRPFMPSAYEIADALTAKEDKKEDLAPLIVNEIIQAIQCYGQYDEERMIQSVSEDARLVLRKLGNTTDIRNADIDNLGTTKAQLRDFVKGVLAAKANDAKATKLESIGIDSGRVLDFKKVEMRTMDYSNFLPGDPA